VSGPPRHAPDATGRHRRSSRSQSEVIGVALLTGVVVLLGSLVALGVLGNLDTYSGPSSNLEVEVGYDTVTLSHQGGDSLAAADTEVVFGDGATERYGLGAFAQVQGDAGRFEPGEAWRHGHSKSETIRIIVVHHGEEDTVVLDVKRDVPANP
jgi:FlaG/FlaF family flagellin (archaellin)